MQKGQKISSGQAIMMNIILIIATGLLSAPAISANYAGQDAWLSFLMGIVFSLPIAFVTSKLGLLFPGKTLIEYLEKILGVWFGKALALLYLFYFIHITSIMIREYGEFISDVIMPTTPLIAISITGIVISAYAVASGIEVVARTVEFFFLLVIFSVVIIFLLAIPEMSITRLLPVIDTSSLNIFKGSLAPWAWMTEIFYFAMIIPFLAQPKDSYKITFVSIALVGLIFLMLIIGSLLVFGPSISSMIYPVFDISRSINIAKTIDRPDPFIMAIWVIGGFLKISIFYFGIVWGLAQWLKLNNYKPLVLPMGIILVALSMLLAENSIQITGFIAEFWPFYALILFQFGIPVTLFFIALFKKGKNT